MRSASLFLTFGLLALAGCITAPPVTIAPMTKRASAPAAAAVRAKQVTPQSAEKMYQALADELDREAQQNLIGTAMPKR
jgi:hypothetical protein